MDHIGGRKCQENISRNPVRFLPSGGAARQTDVGSPSISCFSVSSFFLRFGASLSRQEFPDTDSFLHCSFLVEPSLSPEWRWNLAMRGESCGRNWQVFVRPESCINYSLGVGYEIQMSEQKGRFLSQNIFSPPLSSGRPRSSAQVKPLGWPLMQSFNVEA